MNNCIKLQILSIFLSVIISSTWLVALFVVISFIFLFFMPVFYLIININFLFDYTS